MRATLHPIAAIFQLCLTEKTTIASKPYLNQIKGNFFFEPDEIDMISTQLLNGLNASKIIPENRFSVKFDANFLQQVYDQKNTDNFVLMILLSCVSWLIECEKNHTINNFGLVLDLLDSVPSQIAPIYQIINYIFICVLKLNIEVEFLEIEKQISNFCDNFKNNPNFIENTILLWIQMCFSFEHPTNFSYNLLSFASHFYENNQQIFNEEELNILCFLLNPKFKILDQRVIEVFSRIANVLPPNIVFEIGSSLIDSLLPVFEKNELIYAFFNEDKLIQSPTFDSPIKTTYSLQFSSNQHVYNEKFLLTLYSIDKKFQISPKINSYTIYISKILNCKKIDSFQYTSALVKLIKDSLNSSHFFDVLAAVLTIIMNVKVNIDIIIKCLLDSHLFNRNLTIFSDVGRNEDLMNLRIIAYKYVILASESNVHYFFNEMIKYPLIISEIFYISSQLVIPLDVLYSDTFLHAIYITLLTYFFNTKDTNLTEMNAEIQNEITTEIKSKAENETRNNININEEKIQNAEEKIINDESDHEKENIHVTSDILDDTEVSFDFEEKENTSYLPPLLPIPKKPLNVPDEFGPNITISPRSCRNLSFSKFKHKPSEGQIRLCYSRSIHDLTQCEPSADENRNKNIISDNSNEVQSQSLDLHDDEVEIIPKSISVISVESFQSYDTDKEGRSDENEEEEKEKEGYNKDKTIQSINKDNYIMKIIHQSPIDESSNNFALWFNKAKTNEIASLNDFLDLNEEQNLQHCAVTYVLAYISQKITDLEVAAQWNESMELIPALFSLLFDEYLRSTVFSILRTLWSAKKSRITTISQGCIQTIFEQKYDSNFALLDLQLLININQQLMEFPTNTEPFMNIHQALNYILANSDISSVFLHNSMIFFSFFSEKLKRATRAALSSALFRVVGKEPNQQFYHDFILIITSFDNELENPYYLIKNSKVAALFVETFFESSLFGDVIHFIDQLCQISFANSLECHKGGVDKILIKYIEKYPESSHILNVLTLFSKIALRASSMPVVSHLISLFCPIKSNFLPPYIIELTKTFTDIVGIRQCQPIAYFPISQESPSIKIMKLSSSQINQGFTFVIKLFMDHFASMYQPRLLTISDKKQFLTICVFESHIMVYNSLMTNSLMFSNMIPKNTWTTVAISILPHKKRAECHIFNQNTSIEEYNFIDFQYGTLLCEIGSGNSSASSIQQATMIGGFGLYPYTEQNRIPLNFQTLENPLISVKFEIEQSLFCLKKSKASDLDAILSSNNLIQTLSLPDVLVRFFKAEVLIPLFAQVDLNFVITKEQLPPSFVVSILHLLTSVLQISVDAQQSFANSHGFCIISYLLLSNSPQNLTFDLYLHFVLLFEAITVNELKVHLFSHVLINSEIWSLTPSHVCQQILYHWDKNLLIEYPQFFINHQPINKLLKTVNYFYKDIQKETRTLIVQLLFNVSKHIFNQYDAHTLIMTCIGSSDITFIEDILIFIQMLAKSPKSPLLTIEDRTTLFYSLNFFLKSGNEDFVISVISTIVILHNYKIINDIEIYEHIEIIMFKIRKDLYNQSFILKLLNLSYAHPEVLSILFYITANLDVSQGNEIIPLLFTHLSPDLQFSTHKLWVLWPIIVSVKYREATSFILDFIVRSSRNDWQTIFIIIEIVSLCFRTDPIPIQRIYLTQLAKCFLNDTKKTHFTQFIKLSIFFIISKPKDAISKALNNAFAKSPFIHGNEMQIVSYASLTFIPILSESNLNACQNTSSANKTNQQANSGKLFDISDFFSIKMYNLANSIFSSADLKFGLDLDENGEWLDRELSQLVIKTSEKMDYKKYNNFILNLAKPSCDKLFEIYQSINYYINCTISQITSLAKAIHKNRINSKMFDESNQSNIDLLCHESSRFVENDVRSMNQHRNKSKKRWTYLWRQLTTERAPWRNSLPQSITYYKRNNRILSYFCPIKLKINMNFNQHKDASFNRDFGSVTTAKKHFEEFQKALEEQYRKEDPPPLLKLTNNLNDDIDDENINNDVLPNSQTNNIHSYSRVKEKPQEYKAKLLTIFGLTDVVFVLMKTKCQIINKLENKTKTIEASNVTHILFRSFLHQERTFEIITSLGKTYLLNLCQVASLDLLKLISGLSAWQHALIQTLPHIQFIEMIGIQKEWCRGLTSNFEYLMQLNFLGGRTFNETSLYPVFPWILKDYSSSTICINDPSVYRDLSVPMGAQNIERLTELKSHMKDYMAIRNVDFLYNSCYISPLCVFLWLIRMEPFTTLHIQLQGDKFDHAARVFASIPNAFRMATTHMNDYRELIPEFFFTSSFLENRNRFDLGSINHRVVDDVVLPKWASSAIDFIYTHRKFLESDYVSSHLNEWIDLIFGYRQKGTGAKESNNTFDPCLYEDVWTEENINDPAQHSMIEALLQHCGHIPNQLFKTPHPTKKPFEIKPISKSMIFQTNKVSESVFSSFFDISSSTTKCIVLSDFGHLSTICIKAGSNPEILPTCTLSSSSSSSSTSIKTSSTSSNSMKNSAVASKMNENNDIIDLSMTTYSSKMSIIAFCHKNSLLVTATDTGIVNIIDVNNPNRKESLQGHIGKVNCVSISKNYIVSGGSDTTINIWSILNNNSLKNNQLNKNYSIVRHTKSIQSFRNEITCIDICEKFGTIAIGTKDGSIILIDTESMIATICIDISFEVPVFVKITPGWGFILVYSTKEFKGQIISFLSLYDVDGQFIRRKQLDFAISCWETYMSIDGFDYVAAAGKNGIIYLFEAFYLDIGEAGLPRNNSKVKSLMYSPSKGLLFALRKNGSICVYSENDMELNRFKRTMFGTPETHA
ncbi:hypothetical protein TRFO_05026 [Tritrichomonas foetus]|uniref:BEACH domain-containing protein n=1 Tax=Tritrichomonas foetus TaxID=1144522 RepID=A0A1J4KDX5_9EUKA|nr:hypothetical protein TRFO_05026 [Tritrichomonas foetus]|eukprot:OHT07916.1 hypothetical protein TRFO_05026 [Tritrichomonas foetus]